MRSGNPGTPYPNRTDLGSQPNLPARVATDQTYGKAQSQLEAQRTIPMAPPSVPLAPGGASPAPGASSVVGSAPGAPPVLPGGLGDLHRPTERPFEPVTAGAPTGPGPGPEALANGPANPAGNTTLSTMLAQVARSSGSQAVAALAQHALAAGQ